MKDRDRLLKRYRRFRSTSRHLNDRLLKTLSQGVLVACGEHLGVFEAGTLYLEENEVPLFFDYCLR